MSCVGKNLVEWFGVGKVKVAHVEVLSAEQVQVQRLVYRKHELLGVKR